MNLYLIYLPSPLDCNTPCYYKDSGVLHQRIELATLSKVDNPERLTTEKHRHAFPPGFLRTTHTVKRWVSSYAIEFAHSTCHTKSYR